MGLQDRDYMRESYKRASSSGSGRHVPKAVKVAIVALLIGGAVVWFLAT